MDYGEFTKEEVAHYRVSLRPLLYSGTLTGYNIYPNSPKVEDPFVVSYMHNGLGRDESKPRNVHGRRLLEKLESIGIGEIKPTVVTKGISRSAVYRYLEGWEDPIEDAEAFGENESATLVSILVIVGLLVFFVLEKFLHWHHSHGEEERCENERTEISDGDKNKKIHPLGRLILVSDGLHNFIDGTIIGVSYLASIEIGVATTIAVILHEIPQEFGDFGILIHSGFSRTRALFLNFLSASLAIAGALVALLIGTRAESFIPFVLPFAAGTFIYIATADLIPELHKTKNIAHSLIQILAIIVGVLAMLLLLLVEV